MSMLRESYNVPRSPGVHKIVAFDGGDAYIGVLDDGSETIDFGLWQEAEDARRYFQRSVDDYRKRQQGRK